jgi:hypothetical protein
LFAREEAHANNLTLSPPLTPAGGEFNALERVRDSEWDQLEQAIRKGNEKAKAKRPE